MGWLEEEDMDVDVEHIRGGEAGDEHKCEDQE